MLYSTLFLVSGAALLAVTYALVARSTQPGTSRIAIVHGTAAPPPVVEPSSPFASPSAPMTHASIAAYVGQQRAIELRQLLLWSGIALAVMAVVSVLLGWLLAGRALRPVRVMADRARRISEHNLHERLAMTGPRDELTDLGGTVDGLLGRLETAFEAQKRFVANASHELRTPLTLQRAMIEVALADPHADAESLRAVCQRVLVAGDDQARLIEALLTLAHSQRGLDHQEPVDLAAVAREVIEDEECRGYPPIRVEQCLDVASTSGDARLLARLVTNLVDNAVRHNVVGGWATVRTGIGHGRPLLRVTNSGPVIPADRVDSLFQPFQRLTSRTRNRDGHGLGLSIVTAIVLAHDAELTAEPLPGGGLAITVFFRPAAASRPDGRING